MERAAEEAERRRGQRIELAPQRLRGEVAAVLALDAVCSDERPVVGDDLLGDVAGHASALEREQPLAHPIAPAPDLRVGGREREPQVSPGPEGAAPPPPAPLPPPQHPSAPHPTPP